MGNQVLSLIKDAVLDWLVLYFFWILHVIFGFFRFLGSYFRVFVLPIYHAHTRWINTCLILLFVMEFLNFTVAYLFKRYIKSHSYIYQDILKTNYNYPFYKIPAEFAFSTKVTSSPALANASIEKFAKEQFQEPNSQLTKTFETAALNRFQLESYTKALNRIQRPLLSSRFPTPLNLLFQGLEKEVYTNAMAYPVVNPKYYLTVQYDSPAGRVHRTKQAWCDQAYLEKLYKQAKKIPDYKPISTVEKLFRKEADEKAFKLGYISELPNDYDEKGEPSQQSSGIPPKMRYNVIMRDHQQCVRCRITAAQGASLDVYHKLPPSRGGTTTIDNLYTLCDSCAAILNVPRKKAKARKVQFVSDEFKRAQRARMTPAYKESILRRDGYRCQICGKSRQDGASLEVDHIKPVSLGGTSDASNLRTLCFECNRGKGATYDPYGEN